ncbi:MAG: SDR family NAD(P)-dependent oxidoreductase [Propionibacteriales bacterium]|nr:SDR family NAD(P)-dependent oxidoreductase [Propionibacteriales bacterium]
MSTGLALVTGCHGGLGSHVVSVLLQEGWEVVGVGRRPQEEGGLPTGATYLQVDAHHEEAVQDVVARLGRRPSLVVHAASEYPRATETLPAAVIEAAFRVNSVFPYLLDLAVLDMPRDDHQGVTLVTVGSEAMFHADAVSGVYAATKAAARVLTTAVADRCRGTGDRACTLVLGPLLTPGREDEMNRLATRLERDVTELTRHALARSNPSLVIDQFIDLDACARAILALQQLGTAANGAVWRLDGGSAGSLI